MARWSPRGRFGALRPPAVMVPDALAFAGQVHVNGLSLAPVRAEVAATILELLQVFDGVCTSGSGHSTHSKREGYLYIGKYKQQITNE